MKYLPFIIFIFSLFNFAQTETLTNNSTMIDSSTRNNNSITLAGASVGFTTGTSMLLLSGIAGEDVNVLEAITIFLGPSIINGIVIPNYLESQNKGYLRTGVFVSSCATTVLPMFGAMFGAPNSDPSTIAMLVCMGTIGGVLYNHALALIFPKYKAALKSAKFIKSK
mgnify:FL=1